MNSLTIEARGTTTIVRPEGQLTIGFELDALHDAITDLVESGARKIVLDLSRVLYVDSAALGEIVAARRRVRDAGGAFALARPTGKVRDLLMLTRLDTLVSLHDDLDGALGAVNADS